MAFWTNCGDIAKAAKWAGAAALLAAVHGCGQSEVPPAAAKRQPNVPTVPVVAKQDSLNGKKPEVPAGNYDPRLHQPFLEAVTLEPPGDQGRPPDVTRAGKSVGMLYQQIAGEGNKGGLWEQVKFTTPDGKPLQYTATIKTDLGDLTVELLPQIAPNHVRSFVALARAGYYNGLQFDRAAREMFGGDETKVYEYLEAGCPVGTGEPGYGSIGYWLKPEFSDKVKHAAGVVAAARGDEPDSAACKFTIALSAADWLDGQLTVFGKITGGMDVARRIFDRPKVDGLPDRPREPVVIREVVIQAE